MHETGKDDQFGEGVHVGLKDGVIEDYGGISIETRNGNNDIDECVNEVDEKVAA